MKSAYSLRYITFLIALIFCCHTPARAQSKEYPSLLWEITGKGLSKPSYLYGTMHVSKKVAFHLTEAFFEGLKSTDVVALETNPETWLSELMAEGMSMSNNNQYRNFFTRDNGSGFYGKAFDFTIPRTKYIQQQIAREPENVNSLLYRFNGHSENFEEYTYLDLFIFQSGKKLNKKIVALEDFKTSMEMLIKGTMPDDDKIVLPKRKQVPYNIGELIEDAYRNGDLDALDSLNKISYTSKNFEKYMLIDRNIIMADHMDSIMKKQSLFTAIGAAHLPGDLGVINLLKKMGYTVKPVKSSVSKKSIKTMDGYEEMHTPLAFNTQFAGDSSFKVDAPGKLFAMVGFDQMDTYLYTDMVNGSYYMVKRIRNYGVLMGQDKAYQERRIDSILYESIPGKIIRKEAIKANNGDPGFDITNKTRRGDLQRYRIYMSDKYISIFKVAGNGDYVQKADVDKFFKSIQFDDKSTKGGWTSYSPAYGGYEISVPPGFSAITPSASEFQKERVMAGEGNDFYMLTRSVMNDYYYIEEDTFELSQLAKNFYEEFDFEQQDKKFGTHLSFPCIDVTAKKKNGESYLHLKIIMKDQQYYMLACTSPKKEKPAAFFSSLKFKDFRHDKMQTYTDTTLYFSVKTDYSEAKKSVIQTISDPLMYYYSKRKKPGDYENWERNKTIESPSGSETVLVQLGKANDYRSDESPDELWKEWLDYYQKDASLVIRQKKRSEINGLQTLDLVLHDTNSIKEVHVRMILKNGIMYTLNATVDSVAGPGPWVKTFFETFTPADTVIGLSTFADKTGIFFKDLASKDSATREKINTIGSNIRFKDKHAAQLMSFIAGPDFNNVSLPMKGSLVRDLGDLKDPAIAGFLQKEYLKYADSASIQLSVLQALASQKTIAATKAFVQSLTAESPLSNEENDVSVIFYPFYDSLKLAATLYPQLLQLTRYAEYKPAVYALMSRLIDSAQIKPLVYDASKKDLLREANDELKRQISSEENNSGGGYKKSNYTDYGDDDVSRAVAQAMADAEAAAAMYQSSGSSTVSPPDDLLVNYCNLLAPFYAEPAIKTFFGKAFKTKSPDFKISLISIMLKNKLAIPDTMVDHLSKDIKTRVAIYLTLDKLHQTELIKPQYRSQESLVQAELYAERDLPADSIHFITSRYVESKKGSGMVYFYTSTEKDGTVSLDFMGSQPKDATRFEPGTNTGTKIVNDKDKINEQINKACYELSLTGRKRVQTSYWNEDYAYGDY